MPELPDLQVFSRNLTKLFTGKKVRKVNIPNAKKLNVSREALQKALEGKKVREIYRAGKELHFKFDKDTILGLHLMLRGQLHFFEGTHDKKYPVIELYFANGDGLVMTDFQGQAAPTLNPKMHDGVDALSPEADFNFLKEILSRSKATVKNLLLDQHIIRGIGNAYVDEILWHARISPFSVSSKIPTSGIRTLAKSIRKVLKDAEKSILKSDPDIISGEIRDFLSIHNSSKKKSPTGYEIIVHKAGARKTYYTEEQKLFK